LGREKVNGVCGPSIKLGNSRVVLESSPFTRSKKAKSYTSDGISVFFASNILLMCFVVICQKGK